MRRLYSTWLLFLNSIRKVNKNENGVLQETQASDAIVNVSCFDKKKRTIRQDQRCRCVIRRLRIAKCFDLFFFDFAV